MFDLARLMGRVDDDCKNFEVRTSEFGFWCFLLPSSSPEGEVPRRGGGVGGRLSFIAANPSVSPAAIHLPLRGG